ncbi:MAG: 50S ribosomal protein L31 [Deltaproteobacteria bacterium]
MKANIHPKYNDIVISCACGASYKTRSSRASNFSVEICSNCHPFYTGRERSAEARGRVERFNRKYKTAS